MLTFFFETSNGRLPLEQNSDRRETLAKRVSDDLQLFMFRCRKTFLETFFSESMIKKKVAFWRSYEFLIRVGRCVVKSYCPNCPYFWGDILGEGVKVVKRVFWLGFGPKMTLITSSCDVMTVRYYDNMIIEFMEVYGSAWQSLWKLPWTVDPRTRTK